MYGWTRYFHRSRVSKSYLYDDPSLRVQIVDLMLTQPLFILKIANSIAYRRGSWSVRDNGCNRDLLCVPAKQSLSTRPFYVIETRFIRVCYLLDQLVYKFEDVFSVWVA